MKQLSTCMGMMVLITLSSLSLTNLNVQAIPLTVGKDEPSALLPRSQSCSTNTEFDPNHFVEFHNQARKSANAGMVEWNDDLANFAQCWANRCKFEHSHTRGIGENIAAGSFGPYTDLEAFREWWEEYHLWEPGMGFQEETGHYTQAAWKNTTSFGCGVAICPSSELPLGGTYKDARFVVCEYHPQGNVIGQFEFEVSLPKYDVFSQQPQTQPQPQPQPQPSTPKPQPQPIPYIPMPEPLPFPSFPQPPIPPIPNIPQPKLPKIPTIPQPQQIQPFAFPQIPKPQSIPSPPASSFKGSNSKNGDNIFQQFTNTAENTISNFVNEFTGLFGGGRKERD